jgi:hypothetical protein
MIAAIFFPADPEGLLFDLVEQASQARRAGLRLYTNGRRFALLPHPVAGWALWGTR